jgi:hypothetical protein
MRGINYAKVRAVPTVLHSPSGFDLFERLAAADKVWQPVIHLWSPFPPSERLGVQVGVVRLGVDNGQGADEIVAGNAEPVIREEGDSYWPPFFLFGQIMSAEPQPLPAPLPSLPQDADARFADF